MQLTEMKSRALLDLSIVLVIATVFTIFSMAISFADRLYGFVKIYGSLTAAEFLVNLVFLSLTGLLWLSYRRWREAAKKQAELHNIINGISPDVLIVIDQDENITMCNASVKRMFGYEVDEVINQKIDFLYSDMQSNPGQRHHIFNTLESEGFDIGLATGKKKDGEIIPLEIITGNLHCHRGAVALLRDITERKQAEKALQQSEEKYRRLVEDIQDGVFVIQDAKMQFVNGAFAKIVGYTVDEIIGMDLQQLVAPEDREMVAERYRRRQAGEDVPKEYEFSMLHKDKATEVLVNVNVGLITYQDRVASMGTVKDITESRRLENQLRQAQKMQAVGVLAGGLAHEFNNMLTIILGYSELLLDRLSERNPARKDIEKIKKVADRIALLTQQLLAFSRKQIFQMKLLDLNTVVADTEKMLERLIGEDIDLVAVLEPELESVKADSGQIQQVIMNLSINARDAMPQGGKLTIKTESVILDKELCKVMPEASPGKFVCLSVVDTGIGMDKEIIERIFEPFFTTRGLAKGIGLGLSTTHGIVKQHGGWINVHSEPGQGSTFKVYLPASSLKPEDETEKTAPLQKTQGSGERILLVEDEKEVREIAGSILGENGYVVFEATTAEEALDIFEKEKGNFHLVFSDVIMPGKSGLQLVEELLSRKPRLRVLLGSGYTDQKSQWDQIREKGFPFIQKPYTITNLLRSVKEAMKPS